MQEMRQSCCTQEGSSPTPASEHPTTTQRQYWHDPVAGMLREVWQPGDGNGKLDDDFHDKPGPAQPLEKRWRLFQSSIGEMAAGWNEPPKYVILDDCAVYEAICAGISKARLSHCWSHDFSNRGSLRYHRVHRGRPAVIDDAVDGIEKCGWAPYGKRKVKYYFTGEPDFVLVDVNGRPFAEGMDGMEDAATDGEVQNISVVEDEPADVPNTKRRRSEA